MNFYWRTYVTGRTCLIYDRKLKQRNIFPLLLLCLHTRYETLQVSHILLRKHYKVKGKTFWNGQYLFTLLLS